MFRACIFDLDGTLADTLPTVHHYCNLSLAHFGLGEVTLEQCQGLCRLSAAEFYSRLLRMGGCPEDRVEELREPIRAYDLSIYMKDFRSLTEPFPGVEELLRRLKERGVISAVLTNKPAPLAAALMADLFPGLLTLVAGQVPGSIAKPDPRSLTGLIERLRLEREECLYIGDTDVDMITAINADVPKCAVTWGYQGPQELAAYSPEYTVDTPGELWEIVSANP